MIAHLISLVHGSQQVDQTIQGLSPDCHHHLSPLERHRRRSKHDLNAGKHDVDEVGGVNRVLGLDDSVPIESNALGTTEEQKGRGHAKQTYKRTRGQVNR